MICGTPNIATSFFTCCSFVKCKKDPLSSVILLTPSQNCFCRYAGVLSSNLLFNWISSFISVFRFVEGRSLELVHRTEVDEVLSVGLLLHRGDLL